MPAGNSVKISQKELGQLIIRAVRSAVPLTVKEARIISDHYIAAEVKGKTTHGIRKLRYDIGFYNDRLGPPKIIKGKGAVRFIDGNREIGPLAAYYCTGMVIKMAKRYGIALVGMNNAQRYGMLSTWCEQIARQGLVGIITNATEPFGALKGIATGVVGTNPISIGIPYKNSSLIYDSAITKAPISYIWQSLERNNKLPPNSFLDKDGKYTTNPKKARSVEVMGEGKGSGLALMLQILTGPMLAAASHEAMNKPYEVGFYFQAIDPTCFLPQEEFTASIDNLMRSIQDAPKRANHETKQGILQPAILDPKKVISLPKDLIEWLENFMPLNR